MKNKKIFILGAGGVAPSIILALRKMGVEKIILSNRTKKKAEEIKKTFTNLEIIMFFTRVISKKLIHSTS